MFGGLDQSGMNVLLLAGACGGEQLRDIVEKARSILLPFYS